MYLRAWGTCNWVIIGVISPLSGLLLVVANFELLRALGYTPDSKQPSIF